VRASLKAGDSGPPASEAQLLARARALAGWTIAELSEHLGKRLPEQPKRAKGFVGTLLEQGLGADAGSRDAPDFSRLGIELKTIPLRADGLVRESTFVCSIPLVAIGDTPWECSRVYRKLACVLWMPVETDDGLTFGDRRIGTPLLWRPDPEEQRALRDDWEELAGLIGCGHTEGLRGHLGRCLQVRPKAAHGGIRRRALDSDGWIATLPRGFYLRARFTEALIRRLRHTSD
jgi:DNA mismatch repair protein MutH